MIIGEVLINILLSGLPCCLLALGIFLTYRLLDFADLTAEGSFLIGGSVCVAMIYNGVSPYIATLVGTLGGVICGLITGVLNTKLNIPKLLSGIITMTATTAVALLILGSTKDTEVFMNNVSLRPKDPTIFSYFYVSNSAFNRLIEIGVFAFIVIVMTLLIYYFFGTEYGMAIRATGMNEKMARAQGINSTLTTIVCVAISNGLIALAGCLFAQDARAMNIKSASGYLVIGLAAILIGESIFGKKTFKNWIISVSLGSIIYFGIITLAIELGLPTELKTLLYAILITIALCIPLFKSLFKKLFKKEGKKNVRA